MERMRRRGLVGFLMGCLICMLMVLPSFVYADVTIGSSETSMVDLEDVNLTTGRNAYVTSSGSVVTGDYAALWASVNGWSVNVASGGMVRATSSGYYGVLFSSLSEDTGTFLNGTVTNYGTIGAIDGTGIALGSGWITNSGSIIGRYTAIDFSGAGTGTATVTNNVGGLIFSHDDDSLSIGSVGTATVTNSGTIQSRQGDGIYIENVVGEAKVTNNAGGLLQSHWGNGLDIYNVGTATVINSGTIQSDDDSYIYYAGLYIGEAGTATVTNSGTIQAYGSGVYIEDTDTATVTNNAGGLIQSYNGDAIYMNNVGTAIVNNSGTIQAYDSGVYIEGTTTATVTNNAGGVIQSSDGNGVSLQFIEAPRTAEVINSGTIQGADDGIYIGYAATAKVTNNAGGFIQAGSDDGIDIEYVGTATVTNSGTIQGYDDGIHVDYVDTATVTNSGTIMSTNDEGIDVEEAETATVTNSGNIQAYYSGIEINGPATATSTANVTNSGMITSNDGDGIYIEDVGTATVTNSGIISGGTGIYMYDVDKANVENAGTITGTNGRGLYIRTSDDTSGSISVTNSGTISSTGNSYNGDAVLLLLRGPNSTAELINTASGVINGANDGGGGVSMTVSYSSSIGEIDNSGVITSVNDGISMTGYGEKIVINNVGGLIYGDLYGIRSLNGHATITNYGTITGADGTAIRVNGQDNVVTLGTGSVINGDIRANNSYSDNYMILDGEGTIYADQMQQFGYLNKTGAGTWILAGDMDYDSSYDNNGHSITVEEGILALAARETLAGVTTSHFEQLPGASLGFVVDATGNTGALTVIDVDGVNETAIFNGGTIVIMPQAGKYASQTTYLSVLDLSATTIESPWSQVTGTAFLKPYLVETGVETQVYDLVLNRLSFSTGALNSSLSLGYALDGMYEDATGDMRTILDELVIVSPGEAQTALAQMGGGTHTAFQFMSFYGINKYHGALNNHLGGGSGFAGGSGNGMAYNQNGYPPGVQTAIAGGGNTMSDVAPILLAMAGNGGQLASGTNWDIWIDGYFSQGNRRSDDVIAKYKQTLYGALMGLDYRATDNLLIGISAGLSQAEVKFDELMDKGNQDSYQGSVYAYYDGKPWYAEGVLTYAYNTYKMDRFINVGGITRLANSEYKGNEYAGYAEVGYKLDAGGIVVIQPLAAFQAVYLMQDGYTETGAGDLNLIVDSQDTGSYQSYLGLRISKAITMGKFVLTPDARAKWAHEFSSDDHLINAKFSSAGSGSFTVEADRPSRDTAIVGVGLTGRFNKNLSMYIQYEAELNRDYTNHTGMLGLRFSW